MSLTSRMSTLQILSSCIKSRGLVLAHDSTAGRKTLAFSPPPRPLGRTTVEIGRSRAQRCTNLHSKGSQLRSDTLNRLLRVVPSAERPYRLRS
ncbi:hypothetical protein FKP32DRAFT_1590095 [Trametes sanguinea]|nr:hypothetical protein FKP32DRAFT_1590095 [Trametes sanguinea]